MLLFRRTHLLTRLSEIFQGNIRATIGYYGMCRPVQRGNELDMIGVIG
jgi:hypothetical protein